MSPLIIPNPEKNYARQRSIKPEPYTPTLEQRFQQNSEDYERRVQLLLQRKDREDRECFQKKATQFAQTFRRAYPERTKEIEDMIRPDHEKQAIEYVKRLRDHNRDPQKNPEKKRAFQDYTEQTIKSAPVMNYFRHRFPDIANYMTQVVKESYPQKEVERYPEKQRQKSHEHSYEFSR